jgi:hypothetical protein
MPPYYDLEQLPVTVKHKKLPPFCKFSENVYIFEPRRHFGLFEVRGYISDSLDQHTNFSFNVTAINSRPYFKSYLSDISVNHG